MNYEELRLRLLVDELFGEQVSKLENFQIQPSGSDADFGHRGLIARPEFFEPTAFSRKSLLAALAAASRDPTTSFLPHHHPERVDPGVEGYGLRYEQGVDQRRDMCVSWQILRSGLISQDMVMREDINEGKATQRLSIPETLWYVAGVTDGTGRYYAALELGEDNVVLRVSFTRMAGRLLEPGSGIPTVRCKLPDIRTDIRTELRVQAASLRSNPDDSTLKLMVDLLAQCGWVNPNEDALRPLIGQFHSAIERRWE
jgi:hypothetical protein